MSSRNPRQTETVQYVSTLTIAVCAIQCRQRPACVVRCRPARVTCAFRLRPKSASGLFDQRCYRSEVVSTVWARRNSSDEVLHSTSCRSIAALRLVRASRHSAQSYPTRPIRVITVNGPGGTADIFLRALGQELQKRIGQPFVVEPRPGGNFTLGARACAEAPPDGYTICMLNNEALAYNQFLFKKIPYDPAKDFAPITNLHVLYHRTGGQFVAHREDVATNSPPWSRPSPRRSRYVAPSMHQRLFFERFNKGARHRSGRRAVQGRRRRRSPASCRAPRRSRSSDSRAFLPYLQRSHDDRARGRQR